MPSQRRGKSDAFEDGENKSVRVSKNLVAENILSSSKKNMKLAGKQQHTAQVLLNTNSEVINISAVDSIQHKHKADMSHRSKGTSWKAETIVLLKYIPANNREVCEVCYACLPEAFMAWLYMSSGARQ